MESSEITRGNHSSARFRKRVIGMVTTFIVAFAVMFGAQSALAYGAVYGQINNYYVAGHWYDSYPIIYTQSQSYAVAGTMSSFSGGGTYTGWAGARGRLFTQDNYLSCEGLNMYNPSPGTVANANSCSQYQSYNWYSWGIARGWTGSGYNDFYTFKSVIQGNW
ncbi:hypothetical protein [Arthrobacter sp. StoSoilB5]|uniref:hypothetical protein n=1 Tax=Arthrobacter sp. StoSoilB5 TaxID=2830992 RepID=UPI001CC5D5B0|nr:hypothetical protein [Arthrobacter sp. StoSoilB5]BCW44611.1 hypothetical protein StoSoilB5_17950 [Arthrobacter sp. StoSoilB5]